MPDELSPIPRAPLDRGTSDTLYNTFVDSFEATREKFSRFFQAYPAWRGPAIPEVFLATIQKKGPNNEADFTDARYYLKRQQVDTSLAYNKTGTGKDLLEVADLDVLGPQLGANLIATNLAELGSPGATDAQGSHLLAPSTPVTVSAIRSQANPLQKYYVFTYTPYTQIQVKVTGSASGGGKYNGVIWNAPVNDISASGTLTEADLGTSGASCLILNRREVGKSTHDLDSSGFLPLIFDGQLLWINSDGTPVISIDGFQSEDCS